MAMTLYQTNIYNNDGSVLLWQGAISKSVTITVTATGATIYASDNFDGKWVYGGSGTFKGIAISANATTPTYGIGSEFTTGTSTLNLYAVVEGDSGSGGGDSGGGSVKPTIAHLEISYSGNVLASLDVEDAVTKTLLCAGKAMASDVVISVEVGVKE